MEDKMHLITALSREIEENSPYTLQVVPYTFPATAKDECVVLSFTGGSPQKSTVKYSNLQVACRSNSNQLAHDYCAWVTKYFRSLRDVRLANGEILVVCRESQPYPYFLGEDENRRFMYSNNFSLVVSED